MTAPIAAILLLKEEELLEHFRTLRALSSETAMTPRALSISEDMTFRRLRGRAVIRERTSPAAIRHYRNPRALRE
jgi:hypothetical protein